MPERSEASDPTTTAPAVSTGAVGGQDLTVLAFVGELKDPGAVRARIEEASNGHTRPLRLDLSAVTYLPSSVVGVLFTALRSADVADVELHVAVPAGSIAHNIAVVTAMPHTII